MSGGSSGANSIDLCGLLTVEQIQAHFGDAAEFGPGTEDFGSCTWDSTESLEGFGMVQVQYQSNVAGLGFDTFVEMVTGPLGSTSANPIGGLGDEAYLSEGGLRTLVLVSVGDDVLVVGVMGGDDETAAAQELAAIALGRL